jgi:cell surface hyaluronidase
VLIDGNVVGNLTQSGTSYQSYSTAVSTVSGGPHTITFQGLDSAGGDNTDFLEQIALAAET